MRKFFYVALVFCAVLIFYMTDLFEGEKEKTYHVNVNGQIVEVVVTKINVRPEDKNIAKDDWALSFLMNYIAIQKEETLGERNFEVIKRFLRPDNPEWYYNRFDKDDPFKVYDKYINQKKMFYKRIVFDEYTVFVTDGYMNGNKFAEGAIVKKFDDGYFLVPDAGFDDPLLREMSAFQYDIKKVVDYFDEKFKKGEKVLKIPR